MVKCINHSYSIHRGMSIAEINALEREREGGGGGGYFCGGMLL